MMMVSRSAVKSFASIEEPEFLVLIIVKATARVPYGAYRRDRKRFRRESLQRLGALLSYFVDRPIDL